MQLHAGVDAVTAKNLSVFARCSTCGVALDVAWSAQCVDVAISTV